LRHRLTCTGYNYRPLSRSPSPYRRKPSRSPSPYRSWRANDRSPSPFRHGSRANRGSGGNDSQIYHKRKASPPRGSRPEKRRNDRGGSSHAGESRQSFQSGGSRLSKEVPERPHARPISYAELENPNAVPDFRDGLHTNGQPQNSNSSQRKGDGSRYGQSRGGVPASNGSRASTERPRERPDIEMYATQF
jgi:serine/threonine-protein kinase PRP4